MDTIKRISSAEEGQMLGVKKSDVGGNMGDLNNNVGITRISSAEEGHMLGISHDKADEKLVSSSASQAQTNRKIANMDGSKPDQEINSGITNRGKVDWNKGLAKVEKVTGRVTGL